MKKIVSLIVVVLMSVVNSVAQINTELYEEMLITKINKYRFEHNLDTFVDFNMVKTVAKMEWEFQSNFPTGAEDPNFTPNMQKVLGMNVYKSYNALINDYWNLKNVVVGNDVEEVFSNEVVKKFITDKREDVISKSLKDRSENSVSYIGIHSGVKNNTFYSIIVFYVTP
jgi:hypothetical protein